jgi:gliding motility-associated-like protein
MRAVFIIFIVLNILACKKHSANPGQAWHSFYHVEGSDTISYMHFPNTFTPDGDGVNDIYQIITSNISEKEFELIIFDKKGENIFATTNKLIGWDGTYKGAESACGNYYYKIVSRDSTGYIYNSEGSLYMMR